MKLAIKPIKLVMITSIDLLPFFMDREPANMASIYDFPTISLEIPMNDIYKTPNAKLENEPEPLGPLPVLAKTIFGFYLLETLVTLASNYISSDGEAGLEYFEVASLLVILVSLIILLYIWHLLKNGKKNLIFINYVFLVINTLPVFDLWSEDGINFELYDLLSLISFLIMLIIVFLSRTREISEWLVRQ